MSENDSQGSDQRPISWIQNVYDIWKFLGVINYQVTLTLMIAYLINSNFASQYLLDIFKLLMLVRPGTIAAYSVYVTLLETHKTFTSRSKYLKQKKLDELNFQYAKKEKGKAGKITDLGELDEDKMNAKRAIAKQNFAAEVAEANVEGEAELDGIVNPDDADLAQI